MKKVYPDWVEKHHTKGTSVKQIRDNYYLYAVTSHYSREKGYPVSEQRYIGKITEEGLIVGGEILFLQGNVLNIGRIFVAPEHFRKGYGSFMMQQIESMFIGVKEITLDTPDWNIRTNSFYTKLGYTEIKRDSGFVYYSKRKTFG